MPESNVSQKQALQNNRMISVQEQTLRKGIAAALFSLNSCVVWARGVSSSSPICVSFFYASAMTFLITGIYNQCGCALRLRWAVSEGGRPFKDRVSVPTQHIKFMKGKRQEVLANFAVSTSFGVAFGAILYAAKGLLTQFIFTGLLYGSATHITVMVIASLLT